MSADRAFDTSSDAAGAPALRAAGLGAPHGFFTRRGGVSTGVIAGLQCGYGAEGEDPAHVAENRARAAAAIGLAPAALFTVHQVHGDAVARVGAAERAAPWTREAAPRADGLVTDEPGVGLGVLAADCAPVLFEDPARGVVGACHAGWRGALGGVVEATLAAMAELGAAPERVRAAVGPCIGPAAYEVGPEHRDRFIADDPAAARFYAPGDGDRFLFDLPAYVAARLAAAGVGAVETLGRCTYSEPDEFYSHRRSVRRGEPTYGRLLSVIAAPPR